MEKHHQDVLTRNWTNLCSDLDTSLIVDYLLQEKILSCDDIERIQQNGKIQRDRARELLITLLRKGPNAFEVFVKSLESDHHHLHELLLRDYENRSDKAKDCGVDELQRQLKLHYKTMTRIHPVSWLPQHRLSLIDVYTELRLVPTGSLHAPQQLTSDQQVILGNLFSPNAFSEDPKRLLIEGEAGIGKTTLLQKLVSMWNKDCPGEECGSPCIHTFDLLFNFHATDFIGCTSIPEVINSSLLAQDCQMSAEILKAMLQKHNIVFVVDAYDEACVENPLLNQLIEKRIMRNATVLVCSRPAHLKQLQIFDSIFVVSGFDEKHQVEYVDKFAKQGNLSRGPLAELRLKMTNELQDLCRNPLILTILCMLCSECLKSDSVKDPRYNPVNMKSSANLPYMYRSPKMCGIVRLDLTGTFAWLSGFSVELSIHSDVWCPEIGGLIPKLRTRKLFI
ncbi:hypothetical protein CAPTEDRAFT_201063 [Capitella teleta]|uniref:CARD domain-containing protein n=1 Tax=Capitella teleta TaxID=283909 RepID=R7VL03_CAPTE|nr:hypothetical protein CAPTEDRAFT_201063 [Capitella teleta]|eukprot:ELU17180.1 hypothetical protein CAPTEDRAFT_201063 [Capitella teleta]